MTHRITVLPQKLNITAADGERLLDVLRRREVVVDAPCGGNGTCGKCRVQVDGQSVLACRARVHGDMTVTLSQNNMNILTESGQDRLTGEGYALAFDIGTTTVAGFLLCDGQQIAVSSRPNPQSAYGADVISRIQSALKGQPLAQTIRRCVDQMAAELCRDIDHSAVHTVSVVGNPAMQQFFLDLSVEGLARPPFSPAVTKPVLQCRPGFTLVSPPALGGFVGADTTACILATRPHESEMTTLLVDIGTNGELVLCHHGRAVCCSTAAGPALEGANITFGMRAQTGAIDHVTLENGALSCSVIGEKARGICGSGLIDAVACALELGLVNSRGKLEADLLLRDGVYLTQEDIRQVQLAKGAICAGIELLAAHLGISPADIDRVLLAGAFGSFMNADNACRIGLLPTVLRSRVTAVGNAAGSGAKMLACDPGLLQQAEALARQTEFLELASVPAFARTFAKCMRF